MTRRRARTGRVQRARSGEATPGGVRRLPRGVVLAAAATLAVVALIVVSLVVGSGEQSELDARVQRFEVSSRNHVPGRVAYPQTPPVGGDHAAVWQNCGYYPAPIAPESGVHSMEHGAVWITYRADLAPAQVEQLRGLTIGQTFILVSPFEALPAPVVASAWGRQLELDSPDDGALDAFIREFRQGPATPEPGAACTGGTGAPQ